MLKKKYSQTSNITAKTTNSAKTKQAKTVIQEARNSRVQKTW